MKREFYMDPVLLASILLLMGFGLVMVYSTSSIYSLKKFNDAFYFLKRQALFMVIGLSIFYIVARININIWKSLAYPLLLVSFVILLLLFTGFGKSVGGARRWLNFGGINIQPVELAKFALIVYLGYSIEKKADKMRIFLVGLLPHLIIIGVFLILVLLQPDFGNAMIILCISFALLYIGGVRLSHIILVFLLMSPYLLYELLFTGYRFRRLLVFLNPWQDPTGSGFQIIQSTYAFASGGLFGMGLGNGRQKLFYLPASHTDFIFSNIGEELGFIGVLFTITLYLVIFWRGWTSMKYTTDIYVITLTTGMLLLIILEALINMCVGLGALPTKGLTLPLLSYGGSSMVVTCLALGIIMNVSSKRYLR